MKFKILYQNAFHLLIEFLPLQGISRSKGIKKRIIGHNII